MLSSSRDDDNIMCSPAFLVVVWRVMLLSTASRWHYWIRSCCLKKLPYFAWHHSSLYCFWWWRLHRAVTWPAGVLCALLYRCADHLVFVFNVMQPCAASYQTMQPGSFWRHASTFQTVSWGSEMISTGDFFLPLRSLVEVCRTWRNQFVAEF